MEIIKSSPKNMKRQTFGNGTSAKNNKSLKDKNIWKLYSEKIS